MKLDLFYEFDVAKPWDGPHPHGQRARAGLDQLLCYMRFGNMAHEKVKRSLELIAKEVMPELERYRASLRAAE